MNTTRVRLKAASLSCLVALHALGCAAQAVPATPDAGRLAAPPASHAVGLDRLPALVDSVKASVVNVEVSTRSEEGVAGLETDPGLQFWERFFGGRRPPSQQRLRRGIGSGVLINPRGLVLTNNHVIEGAVTIRIKLDDGRNFDATVLGRDPLTEVALLELVGDAQALPWVRLGDSDALRVGEWVVAIGNPFGLASSVSAGILSARARDLGAGPYDDFLQTDAAINPGNSGGPLFNLRGEVVGINTAMVGGGTGIGFAVPSNVIKALLPMLEQEGAVTRGWIGVSVQELTPELARGLAVPARQGAVVAGVTRGSPADRAGVEADDVIVAVDGEKIGSAGALTRKVAMKKPGTVSTLTVLRGAREAQKKVRLATRPDLEGLGEKETPPVPESELRHERLGLTVQDVSPMLQQSAGLPRGALISEVAPGSPADRADLRPGMVVIESGGSAIQSAAELRRTLRAARPGSVVLLRVHIGDGKLLRAIAVPD